MSHLTQMLALTFQNFLSAAVAREKHVFAGVGPDPGLRSGQVGSRPLRQTPCPRRHQTQPGTSYPPLQALAERTSSRPRRPHPRSSNHPSADRGRSGRIRAFVRQLSTITSTRSAGAPPVGVGIAWNPRRSSRTVTASGSSDGLILTAASSSCPEARSRRSTTRSEHGESDLTPEWSQHASVPPGGAWPFLRPHPTP